MSNEIFNKDAQKNKSPLRPCLASCFGQLLLITKYLLLAFAFNTLVTLAAPKGFIQNVVCLVLLCVPFAFSFAQLFLVFFPPYIKLFGIISIDLYSKINRIFLIGAAIIVAIVIIVLTSFGKIIWLVTVPALIGIIIETFLSFAVEPNYCPNCKLLNTRKKIGKRYAGESKETKKDFLRCPGGSIEVGTVHNESGTKIGSVEKKVDSFKTYTTTTYDNYWIAFKCKNCGHEWEALKQKEKEKDSRHI